MPSERKRSPARKTGRVKRSGNKTSRRTSRSRSSSGAPGTLAVLDALAPAFERAGVAWCLYGGQAVNIYGVPRLTADLDVMVAVPDDQLSSFIAVMTKAGFAPRID